MSILQSIREILSFLGGILLGIQVLGTPRVIKVERYLIQKTNIIFDYSKTATNILIGKTSLYEMIYPKTYYVKLPKITKSKILNYFALIITYLLCILSCYFYFYWFPKWVVPNLFKMSWHNFYTFYFPKIIIILLIAEILLYIVLSPKKKVNKKTKGCKKNHLRHRIKPSNLNDDMFFSILEDIIRNKRRITKDHFRYLIYYLLSMVSLPILLALALLLSAISVAMIIIMGVPALTVWVGIILILVISKVFLVVIKFKQRYNLGSVFLIMGFIFLVISLFLYIVEKIAS